jgi:alkylation response protein AidB-like acyl-CoA dehydrogenase
MTFTETQGESDLYGLDEESREMVVDTVHQLRKRLLTPEKIREFDKEEIFPEEIIREMLGPEIGLQLLFIPEEYGGMGGGTRDCCIVTREMSKICLGVGTAFFAIQLGADPLMVGGTEAQKEKWLGAISEGDTLVAYAVTEPEAGSNVAALKTKAEPVTDDSGAITGYRINGTKQFISNGLAADFVTVLARTPEGPSFFVVEKGTPGFSPGKGEEKHGIRASNTSPITLTDVVVPVDNLIGGEPGKGLKQANAVFGYTRVMVASMALGAGEAALDAAIAYAKDRIQFGGPLYEKQGYTHKLIVPHAVRLGAVAAYIEDVAARLDAGEKDLEVEGSIAKLLATEWANRAADDAMQALGGYGYICEFGVEKIKRDVKITCIYEGTSEIQQNIISTFRWKKTRKTKGGFYEGIAAGMVGLEGDSDENIGAGLVAIAARALNEAVDLVHENRLTKQQYLMFALADMMAHVEVAASMVRRADRLTRAGSPEAEKSRCMARLFAGETGRTVADGLLKILMGSGGFEASVVSDKLASVNHTALTAGYADMVRDMDRVAAILFGSGD